MPQMNPMFWTSLMLTFIFILLLSNSINYFFSNTKLNKSQTKSVYIKNFNWKW